MKSRDRLPAGFSTLTHARIRAAQGDRSGARRVLRAILEREPWNREALDLFDQLAGQDRPRRSVPPDPTPGPPVEATAQDLGDRFRRMLEGEADPRIHRLSAWLGRLEQQGGDDAQ
jgi:hypothetical protein